MLEIQNNALYDDDVASLCKYGTDFLKSLLYADEHQDLYSPKQYYNISSKKLEGYRLIGKYKNYYQRNPARFIRDFFNIQLLDSQAWIITEAWNKPNVLILASRAYGKSFILSLFVMAKQMLSANPWRCYIAAGTASQSALTFKKIEDIAFDRIDSLLNSTGKIFRDELVIPNTIGTGFSHNPAGFEYNVYNGSFTKTLNSNVDKNRGARAECLLGDEVGFLDANLIEVYKAFTTIDKNFKTAVSDVQEYENAELYTLPKEIPNQVIYISSASSTDTEFYRMYRDYSKKMLMGDPNYFVADIDCELVMIPTIRNRRVKSALTREQIEASLRTNPEKARREYFNIFSTDIGEAAIIRRGTIARNEEVRKPLLCNDTGDKKFVIAYDPARSRDNSVILVAEIYEEDGEAMLRLENCINLLDIGKKMKTPMQTPDQIAYLKEIILDYNIGGDESYSNIYGVYIDAGSGGGGVNIADYLMEDWVGEDGKFHKGMIDRKYSKEYVDRFPNAVDKIRLISPNALKSEIYEAMIEMVNQDKIKFTASYDNKGYLTVFDVDEENLAKAKKRIIARLKKEKVPEDEMDIRLQEELSRGQYVQSRVEKLDWQEELALVGIDAMKEEIVSMVRIRRDSGKDSFELAPEKKNKMNDDRAYVCALAAYALQSERRKRFTRKRNTKIDDVEKFIDSLIMKKGVI